MNRVLPSAFIMAAAMLPATASATSLAFVSGDLVVSVYGNGDGSGNYGDNQASPIVLQQVTTTGQAAGSLVLPQTTTVVNGVTQNAISGEYGSSSEGFLQLSGDGHSLAIMGYGVNAATYNAGGAAVYGNAALAQSTSVPGGSYTAITREVALVGADGSVDTSTALYNVANTNNPRSVATVNGSSFYISGQGVKGDTTQGILLAQKGASAATAVNTTVDTRSVQIANGQVYVSSDSKQGASTPFIATLGNLPTGTTAYSPLAGIGPEITVSAATENGVNDSRLGKLVYLSPEEFFFANATTLYVADSGAPKNGQTGAAAGLGDGGLQKWTFANGTWTLDYTLSAGLNLVSAGAAYGTTGLFGLTGQVTGDTVNLYATNSTVGDLDQSYLYGITDALSATTAPVGEAFTTLLTAAADTKIKGVAFAPTPAGAVPEPVSWMMMLTGFFAIGSMMRRRSDIIAAC